MNHSPKLRALIAYQAEALSPAAADRIERHLAGCAVCEVALAEIQAIDHIAAEIRDSPVVTDFAVMELALRREAKLAARRITLQARGDEGDTQDRTDRPSRVPAADPELSSEPTTANDRVRHAPVAAERSKPSKPSWTWAVGLGVLVAAAVGLAMVSGPPVAPVARLTPLQVSEIPVIPVLPEPAPIEGRVVALVGAVTRAEGGSLGLGTAISEGDQMQTAEGGVHVQLASGTGFVLASNTQVTATRLRAGDIELTLDAGEISSQVETGTPYYVDAPPYRIRVQGTRFEVRRQGEQVAVTLDEGIVEVLLGDELVRHMEAPDRWSSHAEFEALAQSEVALPHLLLSDVPVAPLRFDDEHIVRWQVGQLEFRGSEASGYFPLGDLEVFAIDQRGRSYHHALHLERTGESLSAEQFQRVRRPNAQGFLAPEVISEVVRPTHRSFQRCYERELRRNDPNLRGDYTLRVRVARDGHVESVQVITTADLPPPLRNCLTRTAGGWQFPAPRGGPVTFDLPLGLTAR